MKARRDMMVLSLAMLLADCTLATRSANLAEPFSIRVGESIRVADVAVTLIEIRSDSRCPSDVTCIRAGDAVVELSIRRGRSSETIVLGIGDGVEKPFASALGYAIELLELRPYPISTERIASSDYVATLRITADNRS